MALITCPECSKEISSLASACPHCGCPINTQQPSAKTRQSDEPEIILTEGRCSFVKNPLLVQSGSAILTNHRFIFLKHNTLKTLAIGALVCFTKGDFEFDIPLNQITSIEDGRQGLSKTLIINTQSDECYNFVLTKREEWKIKIEGARKAY